MPKHYVMLLSLTESYVETNLINVESGDDPWLMEKFLEMNTVFER